MRRRQILSHLNPRDNRASVPSGAGMGAAAVADTPSPVSREEEEARAVIWTPPYVEEAAEFNGPTIEVLTPSTDPTAAVMVKKRGRPKGSRNKHV